MGVSCVVIAVLLLAVIGDIRHQQRVAEEELLTKATLVARQQQATRSFLSASGESGYVHGGAARPLLPHEVGRGVSELFADLSRSQIKQTSLNPRLAENAPDEFERRALEYFAAHPEAEEIWEKVTQPDGTPVFRYMMAMRADESCLVCHGQPAGEPDPTGYPREGLGLGDLAGAISVVLPMDETLADARAESVRLALLGLLVAALALAVMGYLLYRQVARPLSHLAAVAAGIGAGRLRVGPEELRPLYQSRETALVADAFAQMAGRLQELYGGLEAKVAERTAQLEEACRELERVSRSKSQLLTMLSHEFRTPLTAIMTFTELMLEDGRLDGEQRERLTEVLESSQRLLRMISDLLDFSRLEAGKMRLFLEVLDVRDVIQDAVGSLRPLADRKGLLLTAEAAGDLPLIHADGLRVTQVLLNLIGNAIKFTPRGGSVVVTARPLGEAVEVAVRDTGPGIRPEDQERVFEPFSRAGEERSDGTGLGLPLARLLVEAHGGRIWLDSAPGRGATFTFTLPIWAEQGG